VHIAGPAGPAIDAFYRVPSPLGAAPPGSIIRSAVLPADDQLPAGATAYRVLYHSQSTTGADIAVSGLVVVPGGAPPTGGFPIASWAHGTTGLADGCAPSLEGPASISYLTSLLDDRMIVVATDYQGLGTPGLHPYLVGQSEAQGVLDAARAARALLGGSAANTVVVVGYSQGGQAALFAGQIAPSYAPELFVAGVVAVGPVASITELAPASLRRRDDADAGFAVMALDAWSVVYGNLPLASVLTAAAHREVGVVTTSCSPQVGDAFDATPTDRLLRSDWSSLPALRADDALNQPGHSPISAPVLVVQGTEDSLIPYATTTGLVDQTLCAEHDTVQYVPIDGAGHGSALAEGEPRVVDWISSRLRGAPEVDSCPGGRRARSD
jgi:alpha-beta hydrolase superfamily lysophospholipase